MTIPRTGWYGTRPAGGSSGSTGLSVRMPTAAHDSVTTTRCTRVNHGRGPDMAHYHDQSLPMSYAPAGRATMSIAPQVREALDRQSIHETSVNKDGYRVEEGPTTQPLSAGGAVSRSGGYRPAVRGRISHVAVAP